MDPVPASPPVLRGMRTRRRAALRSVAAVGSSGRSRAVLRGVVARSGAALHGASRLSAAATAEMRTGMRTRCCAKERWQGAALCCAEQRRGGGEQKPAARSAPWSKAAAAGRARHSAHADALLRPPHQRTPPHHRPLPRHGRHSAPPPSVKGITQRHCVLSLSPHTPVIFLGFLGIFRSWHLATIWLAFLKGLQC